MSNPAEPPKTLKEIIENSWPEYDQALYELSKADHDVDYLITEAQKLWHKLMSRILAETQALIEREVIGEDEISKARPDKLRQSPPWQRNQLRAEQRLRLSKLIGGEADV